MVPSVAQSPVSEPPYLLTNSALVTCRIEVSVEQKSSLGRAGECAVGAAVMVTTGITTGPPTESWVAEDDDP
jgi:hypothetical protein